MRALRWTALWLALASYAFLAWYMGRYSGTDLPPDALRLFQRATWGLNQWTAIVAVLGFARRLAPGDSPALRSLTPAVFPIYIPPPTAIVVFAHHHKPPTTPPTLQRPPNAT